MAPRLTEIRIIGFKSLRDVSLKLDGLSVLIGDNGTGKSSVLEVLELLHATTHEDALGQFARRHGGLHQLKEAGASRLTMGATVDDGESMPLTYAQMWSEGDITPVELVYRGTVNDTIVSRTKTSVITSEDRLSIPPNDSLIHAASGRNPIIGSIAEAFRGMDVHLPFQVTASWASKDRSPRGISLLEPTTRLERFGTNLVNAYQALKNDFGVDHWAETLEYVQLGLGQDIRDVRIEAIPGGGHIALALETRHQGRVPAFSLADGVLSYLAFVALFRLDTGRTLLAFDEPELHLHPSLLARVLGMFEAMADKHPVVLATHSDRLLDGLSDPASSVVVTELDEHQRTRLRRLDEEQLQQWLADYRGLGELRADGELPSVLAPPSEPEPLPTPPKLESTGK